MRHREYSSPRFRLDVHGPIIAPVVARGGDMLVAAPNDRAVPLAVMRREGDRWVRVRVGPDDFSALLDLWRDGLVSGHTAADERWLVLLHLEREKPRGAPPRGRACRPRK
jgi:hypothetical protein